jgi:lysophospholipid hydrolase
MKAESDQNGSSSPHPRKENQKRFKSKAKKEKRPVSVHPDIIARAAVDTTLAVIPARAFQQLTAKYPSAAAHIVQVILARFQRVTFMTLFRYLGLSKELLRIEKRVNEMAGLTEIAADLPDREAIDRLHRYLTRGSGDPLDGEHQAQDGGDDRASLRSRPNPKKGFSKRSSGTSHVVSAAAAHHQLLPSMRESGDESDTSTIESAPYIRRGPPLTNIRSHPTQQRPNQGAFSHLLDEEDGDGHMTPDDEDAAAHERLRETVYDCMMRLIGAVPTEELITTVEDDVTLSHTQTPNSAVPSSDLLLTPVQKRPSSASPANATLYPRLFRRNSSRGGSASVTFPLLKKNSALYSDGGYSTNGTASPTASSASVLGEPMIDIVFYPRGSVLIQEGERLQGLYFVLDGILEASMRGNVNPTDTLTNLDEIPSRKSLFFVTTGGLAGYLAAITGTICLFCIFCKRK